MSVCVNLGAESAELLEHLKDVDVNITGEHEALKSADELVHLLVMLENRNDSMVD